MLQNKIMLATSLKLKNNTPIIVQTKQEVVMENKKISIKRKIAGYLIYFIFLTIITFIFLIQVGVFSNNYEKSTSQFNNEQISSQKASDMQVKTKNQIIIKKNKATCS